MDLILENIDSILFSSIQATTKAWLWSMLPIAAPPIGTASPDCGIFGSIDHVLLSQYLLVAYNE